MVHVAYSTMEESGDSSQSCDVKTVCNGVYSSKNEQSLESKETTHERQTDNNSETLPKDKSSLQNAGDVQELTDSLSKTAIISEDGKPDLPAVTSPLDNDKTTDHFNESNCKEDNDDNADPTRVLEGDVGIVSANCGICYARYKDESQMPPIMHLITKDLSEPYSIYTYRYFIHNWPHLCYLAIHESRYVGAIVCKLDIHKKISRRGYIAMLAVDKTVRRKKIGSTLVKLAVESMVEDGCDEVVLETEVTNHAALNLYENLGFVRDKRLFRYYLNGVDALRLKLWLC